MRVIDTFLYDGEEEMLAARRDALDGLVDDMIAITANRTHQGEPNECPDYNVPFDFYCLDLSEFDHLGRGGVGTPDYQVRERAHRDAMLYPLDGWYDVHSGDIVLMSDVDEIPSPLFVETVQRSTHDMHVAQQRMHEYALDWLHPQCWLGTIAMRMHGRFPMQPQAARDARGTDLLVEVPNGGWHLSWMGGEQWCKRKRSRFSHAEDLDVDEHGFPWSVERGFDVNGVPMTRVEHPESLDWPRGLLDRARSNPNYWRAA